MQPRKHCLLMLVLACTWAISAFAGDEGLYEAAPPADAAFFRVFNASDRTPVKVELDGDTVATVDPLSVTDYGFSKARALTFSLNGSISSVQAKANTPITLIWDGRQTTVVEEQIFADKKKARVKLFNFGSAAVNLRTADGATRVIDGVAVRQYGFRDINALSLPFALYAGDSQLLTTDRIDLKKGMTTSLFLIQNGGTPVYVVAEANR